MEVVSVCTAAQSILDQSGHPVAVSILRGRRTVERRIEGGMLTEQVKNKPYSVILFDEVEKAHRDIFSVLLQILDDGHATDSLGRKINFKNTLIIMTTNLGVKKLSDFGSGIGFSSNKYSNEEAKKQVLMKELKSFFSPEFLNRVDEIAKLLKMN